MISRNVFASVLTACLTAGFLGLAPAADAASPGQSILTAGKSAGSNLIEVRRRGYGPRVYLPIVPYTAYDYPYYYSRGHYPTHIGPGYIYYGPSDDGDDYEDAGYDAGYEGVPYSAKERCGRRFRSFEWDTGLYTTYGGRKKLCPYLR